MKAQYKPYIMLGVILLSSYSILTVNSGLFWGLHDDPQPEDPVTAWMTFETPPYFKCAYPDPLLLFNPIYGKSRSFDRVGPLPMVTVVITHHGERHLERNMWLNVRYANYPPNRLQLLVIDVSPKPSEYLLALAQRSYLPLVDYIHRVSHSNSWQIDTKSRIKGEIVFRMENADIFPANYIPFLVYHLQGGRYHARPDPWPVAAEVSGHRNLTLLPTGTWKLTGLIQSSAGGIGIRHTDCRLGLVDQTAEVALECAKKEGNAIKLKMDPSLAVIRVHAELLKPPKIEKDRMAIASDIALGWQDFQQAAYNMYESVHSILRQPCVRPDPAIVVSHFSGPGNVVQKTYSTLWESSRLAIKAAKNASTVKIAING